jgi:hypothetical protein
MRQTLWGSPDPVVPSTVVMQHSVSRVFLPIWQLAVIALCLIVLSGTTWMLSACSYSSGGVTILWPSNGFLIGIRPDTGVEGAAEISTPFNL